MAEKYIVKKKPLWWVLIGFIIVILIAMVFIQSLREQKWFALAISALVKSFPFGDSVFKLVCQAIGRINGVAPNIYSLVYDKKQPDPMTVVLFLNQLAKLLYSAALLDLFKELCHLLLGADKNGESKDKIKYFFSTFIAVILSSLAGGMILAAVQSFFGLFWSIVLSILIILGTLVAGILIAYHKYSSGKTSFLYVVIKYFLLNSLIILGNSFIILLVLGALQEGVSLGWAVGSLSGAMVILLMLVGLSLAVDSVFPTKKYEIRERR